MSLSIFITGGTSGIGLGLAQAYLKAGHRVGVFGRDPEKFKFLEHHDEASFYGGDVRNRDEIYHAVYDFYQKGGLDKIIASAGLSFARKTQIPNFRRSSQIIDVNLKGTLNTFEPAIEIMTKQRRGHLISISSVASLAGFPGVSAYSAAKAGVNKLCEGYAIDLAPLGIDVTTIAPGFVDTPLTQLNHHPMPFMVDVNTATKKIIKAIEKKKAFYSFPFFFSTILKLLGILPRSLYLKLIKLYKFKYAQPEDVE